MERQRYIVRLSSEERQELEAIATKVARADCQEGERRCP